MHWDLLFESFHFMFISCWCGFYRPGCGLAIPELLGLKPLFLYEWWVSPGFFILSFLMRLAPGKFYLFCKIVVNSRWIIRWFTLLSMGLEWINLICLLTTIWLSTCLVNEISICKTCIQNAKLWPAKFLLTYYLNLIQHSSIFLTHQWYYIWHSFPLPRTLALVEWLILIIQHMCFNILPTIWLTSVGLLCISFQAPLCN